MTGVELMARTVAEAFATRLLLVSPPRTGSTPVARLLWEHSTIGYHCHEPLEAVYWGGGGTDSVWATLGRPMEVSSGKRIPLAEVPPAAGLLVKEMSFQLDRSGFDLLTGMTTAPVVFVVRDPRLSTTSRLRIVRELSGADTFPPFESGWPSLDWQVRASRERGVPYVVVDSTRLRADPAGMGAALIRALGLGDQPGVERWSPRPGMRLCAPEVGALMGEVRADDDPFYRRVLASSGVQPVDRVDWAEEERVIAAAGLTEQVAEWSAIYAELCEDPQAVSPERVT